MHWDIYLSFSICSLRASAESQKPPPVKSLTQRIAWGQKCFEDAFNSGNRELQLCAVRYLTELEIEGLVVLKMQQKSEATGEQISPLQSNFLGRTICFVVSGMKSPNNELFALLEHACFSMHVLRHRGSVWRYFRAVSVEEDPGSNIRPLRTLKLSGQKTGAVGKPCVAIVCSNLVNNNGPS